MCRHRNSVERNLGEANVQHVHRKSLGQDVVSRLGPRARHRGGRARRHPARRLPRPLSRARERAQRADSGARGEAADPERHARQRSSQPSRCTHRRRCRERRSRSGAIADPSYLAGSAAAADIFPGQQLTATRTSLRAIPPSVDSQLTGTQRAYLDLDRQRPRDTSQVLPGDRVDVYISVGGVVKLFRPNVKVITTPTVPGPRRRRQPHPAHRHEGSGDVALRRRQCS